jgi:hypothetical protein
MGKLLLVGIEQGGQHEIDRAAPELQAAARAKLEELKTKAKRNWTDYCMAMSDHDRDCIEHFDSHHSSADCMRVLEAAQNGIMSGRGPGPESVQAQAAIAPPPAGKATVRITAKPDGATVDVDQTPTGKTPLEIVVSPGHHEFLVHGPDGKLATYPLELQADTTKQLDADFTH